MIADDIPEMRSRVRKILLQIERMLITAETNDSEQGLRSSERSHRSGEELWDQRAKARPAIIVR